jgi:spore maturation protein CgeB
MKIILAISPSGNSSIQNSNTWFYNFYEPLVDIGHQVLYYNIDKISDELRIRRRTKEFKEKFSQYFLDSVKREHKISKVDLVLCYFMNDDIEIHCINEIKKMNILTANFSCNNIHQFYVVDKISPAFHYNLHSEENAAEKFINIGAKPIWFQMAANPKYYHPMRVKRKDYICFIGASYSTRPYYIYQLLQNGFNIQAYGPGWLTNKKYNRIRKMKSHILHKVIDFHNFLLSDSDKKYELLHKSLDLEIKKILIQKYSDHLHYPLKDKEMICKYNECQIALGFLEVYDHHDLTKEILTHIHLREFEAPMCGALYMTSYNNELAKFYKFDKEIIGYHNLIEMKEKLKFYEKNINCAHKIRLAGFKRAISCHTYQKRFKDLFSSIDLKI